MALNPTCEWFNAQQFQCLLFSRDEANLAASAFYLRHEKDDQKVILEDKDLEVLGTPIIKYGDSTVIVQHVESSLWLSYKVGQGTIRRLLFMLF